MSHVATVMLSLGLLEEVELPNGTDYVPLIEERVNPWLMGPPYPRGQLNDLCPHFGGGKAPQVCVYGGAFNYLDIPAFLDFIASLPWEDPDRIQVFINDEHDEDFTVYDLVLRWLPGETGPRFLPRARQYSDRDPE